MKTCTKCGEEKPLDGYHVSRRAKDGRQPICKPCKKSVDSQYDRREYMAKWRAENKERKRKLDSDWSRRNKPKKRANCRAYTCAKMKRTPSWANDQLITAYYVEAKRLEELTGIQFHVDHIIPLQGELVSGLHVETNLQLLPANENIGKSNRFAPETFAA